MREPTEIFQLTFGDSYEPSQLGLLRAPADTDWEALGDAYRAKRYAECEAAEEDWCMIDGHGFFDWLVEQGHGQPVGFEHKHLEIDTAGQNAYAPKHWPLCPSCERGRGEETMSEIDHGLNAATWYRACTRCGHEWGHHRAPYISDKPMLYDGGCVPFTIAALAGKPMEDIIGICREHGWSEGEGMPEEAGIEVLRLLGLEAVPGDRDSLGSRSTKLTLARFIRSAPVGRYIVATREHWLAVVDRETVDMADVGPGSQVLNFWRVYREGEPRPYD